MCQYAIEELTLYIDGIKKTDVLSSAWVQLSKRPILRLKKKSVSDIAVYTFVIITDFSALNIVRFYSIR